MANKKIEISEEIYTTICKSLIKQRIMSKSESEAWCYALREIEQSLNKVYFDILPKFQMCLSDSDKLQDMVWNIREEFRHIQYHIDDGKITN